MLGLRADYYEESKEPIQVTTLRRLTAVIEREGDTYVPSVLSLYCQPRRHGGRQPAQPDRSAGALLRRGEFYRDRREVALRGLRNQRRGRSWLDCGLSRLGRHAESWLRTASPKVRMRGSHIIMQRRTERSTLTVPVPNHPELAIGTLRSIIRQSRLPRTLFETD